jgi:Family of unknown function (DUF6252)
MKITRLLAALLLFFSISCEKANPDAPKLSAKVDGKYWEDELPNQLKARFQNGQIIVVSAVCGFQCYVTGLSEGKYPTGRNHSTFGWTKAFNCNVLSHSNIADENTGEIEITAINREKSTVSGKFAFSAIHQQTGTKVQVTEGEFLNVPYTEAAVQGVFEELSITENGKDLVFTETDNFENAGVYYIEGKHPETDALKIEIPASFNLGTHTVQGDYTAAGGIPKIKFQYSKSGKVYNYVQTGSLSVENVDGLNDLIQGTFEIQINTNAAASTPPLMLKGRFKGNLN